MFRLLAQYARILGDAASDWLCALEVIEKLCGAHVAVGMTKNQPECIVRLSSSRKIGINGCSIRHLTLTESPAIHSVGPMNELELAACCIHESPAFHSK